jgi:hypothetical protein
MRIHQGWLFHNDLVGLLTSNGSEIWEYDGDVLDQWPLEGHGAFYDIMKAVVTSRGTMSQPALYLRLYTQHNKLITQRRAWFTGFYREGEELSLQDATWVMEMTVSGGIRMLALFTGHARVGRWVTKGTSLESHGCRKFRARITVLHRNPPLSPRLLTFVATL